MEINNFVLQRTSQQNFTSRKVPRYLYHLTSPENLEKIKQGGCIKTSDFTLGFESSAVFLFELKNFTKNWGRNKDWGFNNLASDLFTNCSQGTLGLTLIRIPTDKLNKTILRVRSLNKLFRTEQKGIHAKEGAPVTESKRYNAKKHAIEYIYPEEINTKNIEVLGSVENFRRIYRKNKLKGLLSELFKGQPEENCIKTLH